MKASVVATSFLATLALSKPLEKRAQVTQWDMETVTVTVTGTQGGWAFGGLWGGRSKPTSSVQVVASSAAASVVTATAAPAPTSTSAPEVTKATPTPEVTKSTPAVVVPSSSAASSAPAAASSTAPSTGTSGLSDYAAPILEQHNLHRHNHSAPALKWDDNMASIAAQIAASCVYAHDTTTGGGGYGQNIGAGAPGSDAPAMITNQMYNGEVGSYPGYGSEPDMTNFHEWGHFSQIVWASTTGVGCATQYCPGGLAKVGSNVSPYFTVCNYSPPGNFGGQYAKNVQAPTGDKPVAV